MRTEEQREDDDDGRRYERAHDSGRHLTDQEGVGPDWRDHVLLEALVVDALRVHRCDAVEADVHGIEREDARHEEIEVGARADLDAAPEAPAERDEVEHRRDHAREDELRHAPLEHDPVAPEHRRNVKEILLDVHTRPPFPAAPSSAVSARKTSSRFGKFVFWRRFAGVSRSMRWPFERMATRSQSASASSM